MPEVRFNDRVAIVTGAGAGLGKSYALEFARRGAKVVVNDLGSAVDGSGSSHNAADLVVEEIKSAGGKAVANYDSVSSVQGGESIVKTALDAFGSADILVNNAGIVRDHSLQKLTEDEWDIVMAVHLKGAYNLTKPALAAMKEKNYGRVIFTSSGVGLYGNFGQANYAAAKMGLVGFMNTLVIENLKYNIKLNAIAPNAASRMTEKVLPPPLFEKLKPEHIAPMVMWLASEQNQETGMIFNCMGGWYSRTAVMCAKGIIIGDGTMTVTPEDIQAKWDTIKSLDGARPLSSIGESFGFVAPLLQK
ncbi:MAG: SDR family oxidoreductase [Spirochaetes bacterium]|nr:SDR family oxidoreductase [Spirochaetota bacterium]